jgi:flagellar hook assembly protein FlgD
MTAARDVVPEGDLTYELRANYPNPFNACTTIEFALARAMPVRLAVFATTGRLVRTLVDQQMGSGIHQVHWDGRDASGRLAASGAYFYRLEAGNYSQTRRMTLVQ